MSFVLDVTAISGAFVMSFLVKSQFCVPAPLGYWFTYNHIYSSFSLLRGTRNMQSMPTLNNLTTRVCVSLCSDLYYALFRLTKRTTPNRTVRCFSLAAKCDGGLRNTRERWNWANKLKVKGTTRFFAIKRGKANNSPHELLLELIKFRVQKTKSNTRRW